MSNTDPANGNKGKGDEGKVKPLAREARANKPDQHKAAPNKYKQIAKEKLADPLTWFTLALVLVSALQWHELYKTDKTARETLGVFDGQLKVMKGQLAEMKSSTEDTKRTIKAFEKLADAAHKTAELTERNYLPVVSVSEAYGDGNLVYDGGLRTSIRVVLKKTGTSVDVFFSHRTMLQEPGVKFDSLAQERNMCERVKRTNRQFLQNDGGFQVPINFSSPDIARGRFGNGDIFPTIIGCLEYTSGSERRLIGFTVVIKKVGGPLNLSPNPFRAVEWAIQRIADLPNLTHDSIVATVTSNYVSISQPKQNQ